MPWLRRIRAVSIVAHERTHRVRTMNAAATGSAPTGRVARIGPTPRRARIPRSPRTPRGPKGRTLSRPLAGGRGLHDAGTMCERRAKMRSVTDKRSNSQTEWAQRRGHWERADRLTGGSATLGPLAEKRHRATSRRPGRRGRPCRRLQPWSRAGHYEEYPSCPVRSGLSMTLLAALAVAACHAHGGRPRRRSRA